MIQTRTLLKVSDNSGAKKARCIKILGGFKKKQAKAGDTIIVSIQQLRNRSKETTKIKVGDVYKALIIRTKKVFKINSNGFFNCFNENAIVLLNKQDNPIGTRIIGPVSKKLRKLNYQKVIHISSGVV